MITVNFATIIAEPFNAGLYRLYLLTEARKIAKDVETDLARPTEFWEHKPTFVREITFRASTLVIRVDTEDWLYHRIGEGAPGRVISATRRKALRFPQTFSPKSMPGTLRGFKGEKKNYIFRKWAAPKGIEPRRFDIQLEDKWAPMMYDRISAAFDHATKATGYEI